MPAGTVMVWLMIESPLVADVEPARASRLPPCRLVFELLVEPDTAQPVSPFSNDPLVIPVFGAAAAGELVQIVLSGAVERALPSAGSPYAASRVRSRV